MTDSQTKVNKRRFKRKPIAVKVEIAKEKKYSVGRCESISEGGMLLQVGKQVYAVGDLIHINFHIPGGSSFSVSGKVVYVIKPKPREKDSLQVGVQFIDPPQELKDSVKNYVGD